MYMYSINKTKEVTMTTKTKKLTQEQLVTRINELSQDLKAQHEECLKLASRKSFVVGYKEDLTKALEKRQDILKELRDTIIAYKKSEV